MSSVELGEKLDVLVRLAALQLVNEKPQTEAINILSRSGLETAAIAELVGTTPATVRPTTARKRKSSRAKKNSSTP